MQMFFKKIPKIKRAKKIIYITEFSVNSDCNFPPVRIQAGTKGGLQKVTENTGVWGHTSWEILKNKVFLENAGGLQTPKNKPLDTALPTVWGERLNGGPKAQMLAHTQKHHNKIVFYFSSE